MLLKKMQPMRPFKMLYYKRNSKISSSASIYPFSRVTNSSISHYTYISYNCTINNCELGKFCSISSGVKIGLGKHPVNFISTSPVFYSPKNPLKIVLSKVFKFIENERVIIGNDVWIGANVTILDGLKIGHGAIIGANSVLTKNVEPYAIVGGVPAKLIRNRFSQNAIVKLLELRWWDMPIRFFKFEAVQQLFSKEMNDTSLSALEQIIQKYKKN
jgi:virginiamycin A acetyltransferase